MLVSGLEVEGLPENWQPINLIVVIECIDLSEENESGSAMHRLAVRSSADLTLWSAIGMLEATAADLKAQFTKETL